MRSKRQIRWIVSILSFLLLGCIELATPPPAAEIPSIAPSHFTHLGIEPNLSSLQTILENSTNLLENQAVLVNGSPSELIDQVKSGALDGAFVYQKPADSTLWTLPIALDSISVVVHPAANVQGLTRPQLQQIFAGSTRSWQPVAGQDQAISVFVLDSTSGINQLFNERIMENRPFGVSAVIMPNLAAMNSAVAETDSSIGFLPSSAVINTQDTLPISVDEIFPQFNTVRSQSYPLTIPVYLVAVQEPQGELRELAAWLQSAEGQQALSQSFVQLGTN